ncbi:hypothetical protein, partial [Acinetobacter bereziniae]|uniref:hypothetical protein n=1 Tax=Acinetobacter bereziniae TaxID=106648 RepID=UPI002576FA9C
PRFNRPDRNAGREWGDHEPTLPVSKQTLRPMSGRRYEFMDASDLSKAHFYVLNNCEEIEDLIE